jgi:uncharacterized phage protein gp47/JayE
MKYDLTRWNRAGLKKFRYVDDNAATLLEALRQDLQGRFPVWSALVVEVPTDETTAQRNQRLEQQYVKVTREWGWEIARSFARAAHVLAEHLDAYANEGYLGTATQWENVRRLVEMIGYHPAPPASASTPVVLLAKTGESGLVGKGFQINHTPKTGAPVLFETLEDLTVDAGVNDLRMKGWNRSPALMTGAIWQLGEKQDISAGALAILRNEATALAYVVRVSAVDEQRRLGLSVTHGGDAWAGWHRGDAVLLFNPAGIFRPRLNGSAVIQLPAGHGLVVGDIVAWHSGSGTWQYNTVLAVDGQAARLNGTLPGSGTALYRAYTISSQGGVLRFPSGYRAVSSQKSGAANNLAGFTITTETGSGPDFNSSYKKISTSPPGEIYLVPMQGEVQATVAPALTAGDYVFPGSPNDLAGGDLVVAELPGNSYQVLHVKTVSRREDDFTLTFVTNPTGQLVRVYGSFKDTLRPLGCDVNGTALASPLLVELSVGGELSRGLSAGKRVILEQLAAAGVTLAAHSARITSVNHATGEMSLDSLPEASSGFTLGNTVLRCNVVLAGHGETKPAKVLGGGDATRSYQQFTLKEKDISFVADAGQPSGVAAAIEVTVAGRIWTQQATLDDSEPADSHYTVQLTEDGYLRIGFGDGEHGRRLPTGTNNVLVTYRSGTGLAGNVPAASLIKPVKPHVLIDKVRQPLTASGGNDRESIDSLRTNAPAALFTLGRAVSLDDYARLAARNAGVWQARSFRLPNQGAQQELIEVVVVPAGGGSLGELSASLRDFLEANDLPGASVNIVNHVPVPFDLIVTAQVDSTQYVPEQVASGVRQALLDSFALKKRRLGQPLYASEIYQVVEGVTGVASSDCVLGDGAFTTLSPAPQVLRSSGGVIRLIQPQPDQVLILDEHVSTLTVQTKEFIL